MFEVGNLIKKLTKVYHRQEANIGSIGVIIKVMDDNFSKYKMYQVRFFSGEIEIFYNDEINKVSNI